MRISVAECAAGQAARHHDLAKPINCMLHRCAGFSILLAYGGDCLTNNAAEWAPRCAPLGKKALLLS